MFFGVEAKQRKAVRGLDVRHQIELNPFNGDKVK